MTSATNRSGLHRAALTEALGAYGADFARWPDAAAAAEARRAVLAEPGFRAAFEAEKALDALLGGARAAVDRDVAADGARARIRANALALLRSDPLADLGWRRIAAALVLSVMVGSSYSLVFADSDVSEEDATLAIAALAWPEDFDTQ